MPEPESSQQAQLEEAAKTLARNVKDLRETVQVATNLRDDLVRLQAQGSKNRLLINVVSGGLILDLLLTVLGTGLFFHQKDQNDKLKKAQHSITQNQQAVAGTVKAEQVAGASDCTFFYDFGTIVLAKQSSATGFQIVADSRNAYIHHNCLKVKGKLPKADPRLLPYLDPGAR